MKRIIVLPVIFAAVFLSVNCREKFSARAWGELDFGDSKEEPQPPATTADEWLQRLADETSLANAYTELPQETKWNEILKKLRQPGSDLESTKHRLLGEVLANDPVAASQSIRTLLLAAPEKLKGYSREDCLKYLYTFSKDPTEAAQWVEKSLPKADPNDQSQTPPDEISKLLAEDKIDEALAKLREKIDAEKDASEKLTDLTRIARICRLTDKQALYQKAVIEMKNAAMKIPADEVYGIYSFTGIFEELLLLNDWQTIRELATRYRKGYAASDFHRVCLTATYQLDGPAAYLTELSRSPKYGISDSKAYLQLLSERPFAETTSTGELTVRAYMAAGDKAKARVTLSHLLAVNMGQDALYRTAIQHFPEEAQAMFEAVQPYNPYEERPLIWLAELALQAGNLTRSQSFIDQAIALDPSDGEQGKTTRMQAYDVLSRLLMAQGDAQKADFFAKVVKAIRRGEEADDYLHAGLMNEAIRRYKEALGHFQDAYCLQSRLAKTLLKAGKEKEAMEHFQKAFELMPVSFGPVESHCFGCEKIFEDPRVQQVALKTFNRLIESTPQNPRTYYLLGLLLDEMKQPVEAVTAMQKALKLDPKYYNCAKHLEQLLRQNPATVKDAQMMLSLQAGIAPYPDLQGIFQKRTDLKQAWLDAQTPQPSPLKLEPLSLPFEISKPKNSSRWQYYTASIHALNGWTTQELLKENSFVEWIDGF